MFTALLLTVFAAQSVELKQVGSAFELRHGNQPLCRILPEGWKPRLQKQTDGAVLTAMSSVAGQTPSVQFRFAPGLAQARVTPQGWTWTLADGTTLEAKASPPPVSSRLAPDGRRGNLTWKSDPGTLQLLLSFPSSQNPTPDKAAIGEAVPAPLAWDSWPIDLSFLNEGHRPAGKHGPVEARGEGLFFSDGEAARFWGTNVVANAIFRAEPDTIRLQAKRIAAFGWNLVRLFHLDSASWVQETLVAEGKDSGRLNPRALKNLDLWIHCLREEGVYVWLDLHVGRPVRKGDNIRDHNEITSGKRKDGRGFTYFNPDLQENMDSWSSALLNHVNPYTKLKLAEDPAVVALLITNENDLTQHYGPMFVKDGFPGHGQRYQDAARVFGKQYNVEVPILLKPWLPGLPKLFLADVEKNFFDARRNALRQAGWQGMTTLTNWWAGMGLASLPALAMGDFVDAHSYGKEGFLHRNPHREANFFHTAASGSLLGKPFTLSEWNVQYPQKDRGAAPIYLAALAAFQGWDAAMLYAYQQVPLREPHKANIWSSSNDPALMATMPAAALLFRLGLVAPAKETVILAPEDAFLQRRIRADDSSLLRTAPEQHGLRIQLPQHPALPWLPQAKAGRDARQIHDPDLDLLSASKVPEIASDTGELRRNWERGLFTVDAPQVQAACGGIGGAAIALSNLQIQAQSPFGVVAAVALDNKPLPQSKDILLCVLGGIRTSGGDQLPYLSADFAVEISLTTMVSSLKAYPLDAAGNLGSAVASAHEGSLSLTLKGSVATFWFRLLAGQ